MKTSNEVLKNVQNVQNETEQVEQFEVDVQQLAPITVEEPNVDTLKKRKRAKSVFELQKKPLEDKIRLIAQNVSGQKLRLSKDFVISIQNALEKYMIQLFRDSNILVQHRKGQTLSRKDLDLTIYLRGDNKNLLSGITLSPKVQLICSTPFSSPAVSPSPDDGAEGSEEAEEVEGSDDGAEEVEGSEESS